MTWWMARAIATVVETYLAIGALFALAFLPRGVLALDHRLRASPVTVRLLLAPGMTALWPIFLRRWIAGTSAPIEQNAHRRAATPHAGAPS